MKNETRELCVLTKDNFQYELDKVIHHYNCIRNNPSFSCGDITDLKVSIRKIVNMAERKSIRPYPDHIYEEVCEIIFQEIIK